MEKKNDKKIILGSGSLDRKELFEKAGISFEIIVSEFNEDSINKDLTFEKMVLNIAQGKCRSVLKKINNSKEYLTIKEGSFIIIAADTMVICDNKIIGKPQNKDDAYKILKYLSGKQHNLITGVCIYDSESKEYDELFDSTTVSFSELTDGDIKTYLDLSDEYKSRAGAYSLRDRASLFINSIDGSPTNVIGLPMDKLFTALKKIGINLLNTKIR